MTRRLSIIVLAFCLLVLLPGGVAAKKEEPSDLEEARYAMMTRNYLEAEKSFERYLRYNPEGEDRWDVWNNLVDLALSVRNDRKAGIELLEAMLVEYADVPKKKRYINGKLAEQYRIVRNYGRALTLWSSIAEDKDADMADRGKACRSLATVYFRRLEFELAKESLGYCLALNVSDAVRAECLYDLAQTHVGTGDLDKATACFREVLMLGNISESMRTLTVFMLADVLDLKGEDEESLSLFASISETYPNRKVVERRIGFLKSKYKKSPQPPAGQGRK
jgi:hypothetical protein